MTENSDSRITLSDPHGEILRAGAARLRSVLDRTIGTFRSRVGQVASIPPLLQQADTALKSLEQALEPGRKVGQVSPLERHLAPIIVTVTLRGRREFAAEIEGAKSRTTDVHVITSLQSKLRPYAELMAQPWFRNTVPLKVPSLEHFITPDESRVMKPPPASEVVNYEDKFRILRAASDIMPALAVMRNQCEQRDVNVTLCFVDIDDLKKLNERLGEPTVDINILPAFFRTIDRVVYGHGAAFRHGGDEVVLLLPNTDRRLALSIVARLAAEVRQTQFIGIEQPPTISAGVIVVSPDSWLTDWEIVDAATAAKKTAKHAGKNRAAVTLSHAAIDVPPEIVALSADDAA